MFRGSFNTEGLSVICLDGGGHKKGSDVQISHFVEPPPP